MHFTVKGADREAGEKDGDDMPAFGWRSASRVKELSEICVKRCFHSSNVGTESMSKSSERKVCS